LDNIFYDGTCGIVKIGDLGFSTYLVNSGSNHLSVIGTTQYMAPEMFDENYNELVDIWAFGMCVIEMCTLDYPYCECGNVGAIYKKIVSKLKPRSYYKIECDNITSFISCCLENVESRYGADDLLKHSFITNESKVDINPIILRTESEVDKLLEQGPDFIKNKIVSPRSWYQYSNEESSHDEILSDEDISNSLTTKSEELLSKSKENLDSSQDSTKSDEHLMNSKDNFDSKIKRDDSPTKSFINIKQSKRILDLKSKRKNFFSKRNIYLKKLKNNFALKSKRKNSFVKSEVYKVDSFDLESKRGCRIEITNFSESKNSPLVEKSGKRL